METALDRAKITNNGRMLYKKNPSGPSTAAFRRRKIRIDPGPAGVMENNFSRFFSQDMLAFGKKTAIILATGRGLSLPVSGFLFRERSICQKWRPEVWSHE